MVAVFTDEIFFGVFSTFDRAKEAIETHLSNDGYGFEWKDGMCLSKMDGTAYRVCRNVELDQVCI